jgi:hypothetical protein
MTKIPEKNSFFSNSPWSAGFVASRPVVKQSIMVEGHGRDQLLTLWHRKPGTIYTLKDIPPAAYFLPSDPTIQFPPPSNSTFNYKSISGLIH